MRKEKVWLIVHPEEERIFVQPKPVSKSRGRLLRAEGYMIFMAEVTLPPIMDLAEAIPATVERTAAEQWSEHDAPDSPNTEPERAEGQKP